MVMVDVTGYGLETRDILSSLVSCSEIFNNSASAMFVRG
jgi:hypothetical protein